MRRAFILLVAVSFAFSGPLCYTQSPVKVSDPRLEMVGNTIHITYDILNCEPTDEFTVELLVTDANGKRINASALTGDIGDKVMGGINRHIAWDLAVDRIEMNAKIYVKVYVKAIPPPEPVVVAPVHEKTVQDSLEVSPRHQMEETTSQPSPGEKVKTTNTPSASADKRFSRTGLVIQSLAFPGLGLSRLTGNPHWIRGVAGYGCLAGTVILNRKAISTYDGIIGLTDYREKNALYQKSLSQDLTSEVLAYTAIAVWLSDIIWTLVGTSDLKKSPLYSDRAGFSLKTTIEPVTTAPLIGFIYRF